MRLLLILTLVLISCGKEDDSESSSITTTSELEGTWESGCVRIDDEYYKISTTYEDDSRESTVNYYEFDEDCKLANLKTVDRVEGNFEIVGASPLVSGGIEVNHKIDAYTFIVRNQDHAEYLNEDPSFCDKSDWEIGREYDFLELCDDTSRVFTTYLLKDSKLYFALNTAEADGESEESRLVNILYDAPFEKQ